MPVATPSPDASRPFDADRIRAELGAAQLAGLRGLTLLAETDSTNRVLADLPPRDRHAHAVIADAQTAGRGRRARRWHSPPGGNLYLSLGWRFDPSPGPVPLLPLAAAVLVARTLERSGVSDVAVKWPNDVQSGGCKLGGILVEASIGGTTRVDAIIGVGINLRMPRQDDTATAIDQPWTDVETALGADLEAGFRDRLAGRLVGAFLDGLPEFAASGFETLQDDWHRFDALRGRDVIVATDTGTVTGTAIGIAPGGALRVRVAGEPKVREFLAADVSVRAAGDV